MKSGKRTKLSKSKLSAVRDDLRRRAKKDGQKIAIKAKDNRNGTVDVSWTVSKSSAAAKSSSRSARGKRRTTAASSTSKRKTSSRKSAQGSKPRTAVL